MQSPSQAHSLRVNPASAGEDSWLDLVGDPADQLASFDDQGVRAIEACELLQHLTLPRARAALAAFHRVLQRGGSLLIRTQDVVRCMELALGELRDGVPHGGLERLFGSPERIEQEGETALHRWGWTGPTLRQELQRAGFGEIKQLRTTGPALHVSARATSIAPSHPGSNGGADHILAWPRWQHTEALRGLLHVFGRVLQGRPKVVLHLCMDPEVDGERESALAQLESVRAEVLGDGPLEINLHEGPFHPEQLIQLTRAADAVIYGPAGLRPLPGVPPERRVIDARQLWSLVQRGIPVEPDTSEEGRGFVTVGKLDNLRELRIDRVESMHPWSHPVEFDGLRVIPGRGSIHTAHQLEQRTRLGHGRLVQEVLSRVDMRGRRVLDVDCDCAYWSAAYARAGAKRVVGLASSPLALEQAKLYWSRNGLLPPEGRRFLLGQLGDEGTRASLRGEGPFDVVLWAGAQRDPSLSELDHLQAMASEVLILDLAQDPADSPLLAHLQDLGLAPELLPRSDMDDPRTTVVARRAPSLRPRDRSPDGVTNDS